MPALCGFGWMGSNWAKIGHLMFKRYRKVWLSVATVEDIADYCSGKQLHLICIKYRQNDWEGTYFILKKNERTQRTEKIHQISLPCTSDNQNARQS